QAAERARAAEGARAEEARATAAQERRARRLTVALEAVVLMAGAVGTAGIRWVELDRLTRAAAATARVNAALREAIGLRGRARAAPPGDLARWAEAVAAARQARAALDAGTEPVLRRQVEAVLAEVLAEQGQVEAAAR